MLRRAFTLVELLVTIGIIAILASTVVVNVSRSRGKARDARRKADLKAVQTALEVYNDENGSYPSTAGNWIGEAAAYGNRCYVDGCSPSPWLGGLAPTYMAILPSDPTKARASAQAVAAGCTDRDAGYLYNSNGSDYKVLAHCTVETTIATNDPFRDPNPHPTRTQGSYAVYSGGGRGF